MITAAEQKRVGAIKEKTVLGYADQVGAADRQWILDLLRREKIAINAKSLLAAARDGYNTAGIQVL